MPLCPPLNLHTLAWDRTWLSVLKVKSDKLPDWNTDQDVIPCKGATVISRGKQNNVDELHEVIGALNRRLHGEVLEVW